MFAAGGIFRLFVAWSAFVLALPVLPTFSATAAADERFDRLAREIQRLVDEDALPSIAVAVAKDGRIVWEDAFGWADRERRVPATPYTPYSLASISKPFTATAIMKLVEAGRVALDSPANDYLGNQRISGKHSERATIRRVLAHTAGLPPYFRMREAGDGESLDNPLAIRAILVRPPGGRYVYSNLGYGILDRIIERVAGASYAEFMRREVFEPLQLERTFVPDAPPADAAIRYRGDNTPLPFYDLDHRGASSVYASAHDLVRFGMFHLNGVDDRRRGVAGNRLLRAKSIREMQRVHTRIEPGHGYGLGWRIDGDERGFREVGHTGGMPGVSTALSLFPMERTVVVVLANKRHAGIVPLAERVAAVVAPSYAWRIRGR